MNVHFKEIITELSGFCNAHYQIKSFGWGDMSTLNTKDHDYPMVWLNPTASNIEGNQFNLNFEMVVVDLLQQNYNNKLDAMNDMLLIGNDVVSEFWEDEDTYGFTLNEDGVPVYPYAYGEDDSFTIGWMFDISLEIPNHLNNCNIPKS